ncbi:hypothetical protein RJ640_024776 [Escallonia rubra]|uniref:Gag-pol polyprotein n=1 Tax=Escallonia rubra TaxID=112253 RepID=A0AA88UA23_9ASTE|nr:hypothetical protein RJ640_024776 [Escallonia rubra]
MTVFQGAQMDALELYSDSAGNTLAALSKKIYGITDPEYAEAIVAGEAARFGYDCGFNFVQMEGDAILIINALNSSEENLSAIGGIIDDVKRIAHCFDSCIFQHIKRSEEHSTMWCHSGGNEEEGEKRREKMDVTRDLRKLFMGPIRKSRSVNKRFSDYVGLSPDKDVVGERLQRKRKLSDTLGMQWNKEELERFYEAYRKYGKDWKKARRYYSRMVMLMFYVLVAGVLRSRTVDMVEALHNMNRAYLSLPEGTASVVGLIAMMTDHYNVLVGSTPCPCGGYTKGGATESKLVDVASTSPEDGNNSDREKSDASRLSNKPQRRGRGKVQRSGLKEELLQSQLGTSSEGCLSLLKRRPSDVGKRTPRFPISISLRKGDSSPNIRGWKSMVDNDVAHVAALALTEASQGGGTPHISQSSYRTDRSTSSPLKSWERMSEMNLSKLCGTLKDQDYSKGSMGRRVAENGDYAKHVGGSMDTESVGTVKGHRKRKKVSGRRVKAGVVGVNKFDDGREACSDTDGVYVGDLKGNAQTTVTCAKVEQFSSQGRRKKNKKHISGDESSAFDALQTLADLSLMMQSSGVECADRLSVAEAVSTSQQRENIKLSGVREKELRVFSGAEASTSEKSNLGREPAIDISVLAEVDQQPQPPNTPCRRQSKSSVHEVSEVECHMDPRLREPSKIRSAKVEEFRAGLRGPSWWLWCYVGNSSSIAEDSTAGVGSVGFLVVESLFLSSFADVEEDDDGDNTDGGEYGRDGSCDEFGEADWGDLENLMKFKRHLGKERLYEFLTGLNRDLDEVRGRILGCRPLPSNLPSMKHLPKCVVKLAEGVLCLEEKKRRRRLNGDKPEALQGKESEPIPSPDAEQADDHTYHDGTDHSIQMGAENLTEEHSKEGKIAILIVYVDDIIITGVYVDDIIITGDDRGKLDALKLYLVGEFELKDLGALRSAETPMEPNAKMYIEGRKDVDREQYRRLVGKLIYLSHMRLDIAFARINMSNNTTMKYACEQFDGKTKFGRWQSTVKDIIVQQGLLKPLLGNKPESMDQDDWEELQAKAVYTIRLNLTPKVKYQLRMNECSILGDHISEFNRLVSQLSSIDVKLEEEDHAILLLSSLPKSYETLKTTLLIGKEKLHVDDVMSALMDSSRVNGTSSSSHGEGLVVRFENKNVHGRGKVRSRNRNSGHGNDRKCPKRKDKKNEKKHVNNANVAEEDDKSNDGDLYLVSSVEQQECNLLSIRGNNISTECFLDSACWFHMCPHKEWFGCLTPCNSGTVLMDNDAVCKVMRIGTIKIKMFDGIVRTLGDVTYIPDLKKNLISLGTLGSIDCRIFVKGGVMKVSKGAMLIMKGQKSGNLYKLVGNTVIGGASVSTHAGSSNDNSELWHKRLGQAQVAAWSEIMQAGLLQILCV